MLVFLCLSLCVAARCWLLFGVLLFVMFVVLSLWCCVNLGARCGGCGVENRGPKIVKNGPRVWAFCKIEFPGIQKPVQILTQKSTFFRNPGNRGVGVIWWVRGVFYCFAF